MAAADQLRQAREGCGARDSSTARSTARCSTRSSGSSPRAAGPAERDICARLRATTPLRGETLAELVDAVRADDEWLLAPRGRSGTGLEHLICELVLACRDVVGTDFAMSRGMRSLPQLVAALRAQEWERLVEWELPAYSAASCRRRRRLAHFGGDTTRSLTPPPRSRPACSTTRGTSCRATCRGAGGGGAGPFRAADHAGPGLLLRPPPPRARGQPGALLHPEPQPVTVLDRRLAGFVDLRLLRCVGPPFEERDLVVAHRASTPDRGGDRAGGTGGRRGGGGDGHGLRPRVAPALDQRAACGRAGRGGRPAGTRGTGGR